MKNWRGILKVERIEYVVRGQVIWSRENLLNTLHLGGDEFFLQALFAGGEIPGNYYYGMDARTAVTTADEIDDLVGEPSGNGYARKSINSTNWTVALSGGVYRATGGIATFTATGDGWGPVKNLFLATAASGGVLLASVPLDTDLTLTGEDAGVNVRMAMSLRDCPED